MYENQKITIVLTYNPYLPKSDIKINGTPITPNSKLYKYTGERLQVWIEEVMDLLIEEINDDEFHLHFIGHIGDFEDLKEVSERYESVSLSYEETPHIEKTIEYAENPHSQDSQFYQTRIQELTDLVNFMQNGPIEELRSKEIRKNYERAINSEFEIAVVATMSSGKSTLINAILGTDLIPSKNEACTAKIIKIKNIENQDKYSIYSYDKNLQKIKFYKEAVPEILDKMNQDSKVHLMYLEGTLPNIKSDSMNLVLIDTPGTNNSQNRDHLETTMEVIKNETYKPLVLYILNATQLGINDDCYLLKMIRDEMNSKDKQARDRFIFVLNKMDEIDAQKESIEMILEHAKMYLENNGIKNPNIFPAMSHMAKNIRCKLRGSSLTQREEIQLEKDIEYLLNCDSLNLFNHAPLNERQKNNMQKELERFKGREDYRLRQALYYTGIPCIEETINEYLEKYAIPFKIQEAIDSFKRIIDKNHLQQRIRMELLSSQSHLKEQQEHILINEEHLASQQLKFKAGLKDIQDIQQEKVEIDDKLQTRQRELNQAIQKLQQSKKNTESLSQELNQLNENIKKREQEAATLKKLINSRKTDELKRKVNDFKVNYYEDYFRKKEAFINQKITELTAEIRRQGEISKVEADMKIKKLNQDIEHVILDVKTDLDKYVDENIVTVINDLMKMYQKEVEGIFNNSNIKQFDPIGIELLKKQLPNSLEVAQKYVVEKKILIETRVGKNKNKKWYKPWTWFLPSMVEEKIYQSKQMINLSEWINEYGNKLDQNIFKNLKEIEKNLENQVGEIKRDFNKKIDEFEKFLKDGVNQYYKLIEEAKEDLVKQQKQQQQLTQLLETKQQLTKEYDQLNSHLNLLKDKNIKFTQEEKQYKKQQEQLAKEIKKNEESLKKVKLQTEEWRKKEKQLKEYYDFLNEINNRINLITSNLKKENTLEREE